MAVHLWVEPPRPERQISTRSAELVAAFAERHVALPPDLANALARLESADIPAEAELWGAAFRLAGGAVGQPMVLGRTRFWRGALASFHVTVAEPILRRAMVLAGGAGLPGREELLPVDSSAPPAGWEDSFSQRVRDLLSAEEVMGRGFWIEAALRLFGAARRDAEVRAGHVAHRPVSRSIVPEPDPLLCRLTFEAEPIFPEGFRLDRRFRRTRNKSQRKRSGTRPKEGGVSGIRVSTIVDDLPDAIFSELVLPPELVMDRMLHDGLIVRHRPPFRQHKRDLLVLGLADLRSGDEAAMVVKAAWADAALRLRMLLSRMGLQMSDLVWSEVRALGIAAELLRVEDADFPAGLDPFLLEGRQRAAQMFRCSLMPGFVNTLAGSDPDAIEPDDKLPDLLRPMVKVGLKRLSNSDRAGHGHPRQRARLQHRPSDYACRVAITVLGRDDEVAEQAEDDWTSVRTRLNAGLAGVLEEQRVHTIAVLLPAQLEPGARFTVLSELLPGGREDIDLDADEAGRNGLERMLGGLSAVLIRTVLEAIDAR